MYCKLCDLTICTLCITSDAHIDHKIISLLEQCEIIKNEIQKDNDDLRSSVTPKYQKLLYDVEVKIKEVEVKCEEADNLLKKQSDDWHQQITNIVDQLRAEIVKTKETEVNTLKIQKSEIEQTLSKIIPVMKFNAEIQESSELQKAIAYKRQNTRFRTPTYVDISLQMPFFSPKNINLESLKQQFGSLSFISTPPEANEEEQLLLNKPIDIVVIDTGFSYLQSIACTNNNQIWANDQSRKLVATRHLYNFERRHANYHDTKETITQSSEICWNLSETNHSIWLQG